MKDSARYAKIVEWSEEDQCYIGRAPDLMDGGCHGLDEQAVFAELCLAVEDVIETYKQDGTPLPPPSSGRRIDIPPGTPNRALTQAEK